METQAYAPPGVPRPVEEVLETLIVAGFQAYVVGGAPRDWLLGRPVRDFDVATNARPEEVERLFDKVVPTGLKHATVTVLEGGLPIEVTTYRRAGPGLGPEGREEDAFADTIEEDLAARDFTMNAMAWLPSPPTLLDPFGGRSSLAERCLRAVGPPRERFAEDPLRVLRACRLAAVFELSVEPVTLQAMEESALACSQCAVERLSHEILRMMEAPRPSLGIELMRQTRLLSRILPELQVCFGVAQGPLYQHDVYYHSLACADALPAGDPLLRLAGLLHDVGKALARSDGGQKISFDGHEELGRDLVETRLRALALSRAHVSMVSRLVANHRFAHDPDMSAGALRRLAARIGRSLLDRQLALLSADRAAMGGDSMAGAVVPLLRQRLEELVAEGTALHVADLAVSGRDVMRALGLEPGPEVGLVLEELLEVVLDDPSFNSREKLLEELGRMTDRRRK